MYQYWLVTAANRKAELRETSNEVKPKQGEVSVEIQYTTMNYKDALAILGKPGVIRKYALVPGIDFSGIVTKSEHEDFKAGDEVFTNGFGVGESKHGGFATQQIFCGDDIMHKPKNLSLKQLMQAGTAGYTAGLCLYDILQMGITPKDGPLFVSGATGGVGMFAVALAAAAGFDVTAISRKHEDDMLKRLGAKHILTTEQFGIEERPLGKEMMAAAIDCVGGDILSSFLARTKPEGVVAACGLAQSARLTTSVVPFILRGVKLLGINSVNQPKEKRAKVWELISKLDFEKFEGYFTDIELIEAQDAATKLLSGAHKGRFIIDMSR
ncbi:MAG: acryloyl-CoA reductase [Alphaproteobacteria bacterium]